jgi:hypothetical protein
MMRAAVRLCAFARLSLSAETIAENASAKEGCPPLIPAGGAGKGNPRSMNDQ